MILGAAYRSISLKEEGILVGQGKVITMEDAHRAGLGEIFDRVVVELVGKMEEMKMVSFLEFLGDFRNSIQIYILKRKRYCSGSRQSHHNGRCPPGGLGRNF